MSKHIASGVTLRLSPDSVKGATLQQDIDGDLLQYFMYSDKWNSFLGRGSDWFNVSEWRR